MTQVNISIISMIMMIPAVFFPSEAVPSDVSTWHVVPPSVNDVDAGSLVASDATMSAEERVEFLREVGRSQDDRPDHKMEKGELIQKIARLQEDLAASKAETAAKDRQIGVKDSVTRRYSEAFAKLAEEHEQELTKLAEEYKEVLAASKTQIGEKEAMISATKTEIGEKEAQIAQLAGELLEQKGRFRRRSMFASLGGIVAGVVVTESGRCAISLSSPSSIDPTTTQLTEKHNQRLAELTDKHGKELTKLRDERKISENGYSSTWTTIAGIIGGAVVSETGKWRKVSRLRREWGEAVAAREADIKDRDDKLAVKDSIIKDHRRALIERGLQIEKQLTKLKEKHEQEISEQRCEYGQTIKEQNDTVDVYKKQSRQQEELLNAKTLEIHELKEKHRQEISEKDLVINKHRSLRSWLLEYYDGKLLEMIKILVRDTGKQYFDKEWRRKESWKGWLESYPHSNLNCCEVLSKRLSQIKTKDQKTEGLGREVDPNVVELLKEKLRKHIQQRHKLKEETRESSSKFVKLEDEKDAFLEDLLNTQEQYKYQEKYQEFIDERAKLSIESHKLYGEQRKHTQEGNEIYVELREKRINPEEESSEFYGFREEWRKLEEEWKKFVKWRSITTKSNLGKAEQHLVEKE